MKQRKKWIALVLTVVMALSTITPAMATVTGTASENSLDRNGDGTFYYVALGDSITAGYSLPDVEMEQVLTPTTNYKCSSRYAYPYLVAQEMFDCLKEQGYLDSEATFGYGDIAKGSGKLGFGWSNMGISGFLTSDITNTIKDPDHMTRIWATMTPELMEMAFGVDGKAVNLDDYKFHDIMLQELGKADLITVSIGSNDLLQGMSIGASDSENPVVRMMMDGLSGLSSAAQSSDDLLSGMMDALSKEIAAGKITTNHILEVLYDLTPEGIEKMLRSNAAGAVADYPAAVEAIRRVNPDAELIYIGGYNPYGTSLTLPDGRTYTVNTIVNEVMEVIVRSVADSGDVQMMQAVLEEVAPEADLTQVQALDAQMDAAEESAAAPKALTKEWENLDISQEQPAAENVDEMLLLSTAPMTAAQAKKVSSQWDNNWMNWLNWTEKHVDNWMNWSKSTWQAWSVIAEQTNSVRTQVSDLYQIARHGRMDFATSKALLVRLGIDPELIGSEQDVVALATSVIQNYSRWTEALSKFRTIGEEAQTAALEELLDVLEYPLMYLTASKTSAKALRDLNSGIAAYAKESGAAYVDIYDGMPNKKGIDPHPMEAGHQHICNELVKVLFPEVTIVDGDEEPYVEKVLYGSDMTYQITPEEGSHVDNVKVNDEAVAFPDNQVTLTGVKQATKLVVSYAEDHVQPTHSVKPVHPVHPVHPVIQPTVRHHVSHGIFGVVQNWLRWIPFFGR